MSANFRLSEHFRLNKSRPGTRQVPLFDQDFEKLLAENPYGAKKGRSAMGSEDEDVVIGRIPRTRQQAPQSLEDAQPHTARPRRGTRLSQSSDEEDVIIGQTPRRNITPHTEDVIKGKKEVENFHGFIDISGSKGTSSTLRNTAKLELSQAVTEDINKETRQFCNILFGSELNSEEIEKLKRDKRHFFILDGEKEVDTSIFSDLPYDIGYFVIKNKDLLKELDPRQIDRNGILCYRAEDEHLLEANQITDKESIDKYVKEYITAPLDDVSNEGRTIDGIRFGSFVSDSDTLGKLFKSGSSFFLLDKLPSHDDHQAFDSLPKNVGFFVVPHENVKDQNSDSRNSFYRSFDNKILGFGDSFTKEEIQRMLKEAMSRKIGEIEVGKLIEDENEIDQIAASGQSFFILDHEPNESEIEKLENVGYFIIKNKKLLERISSSPSDINGIGLFRADDATIHQIKSSNEIEEAYDSIIREPMRALSDETVYVNNIKKGSVLTSEEEILKIADVSNFLSLDRIPTKEERNTLRKLPQNIPWFVVPSPSLLEAVCPSFKAESKNVLFRKADSAFINAGDLITESTIEALLQNAFPDMSNEKREIEGVKYGSIINESEVDSIIAGGHSFFVLDHIPTPEERAAFDELPSDVGYFIVAQTEPSKKLFGDKSKKPPTAFYFAGDSSVTEVSAVSIENINEIIEDLMRAKQFDLSKESRDICGIKFGSKITRKHIPALIASGSNIFLLQSFPSPKDRSAFDNLPNNVSFFVVENNDVMEAFDPSFTPKPVGFYTSVNRTITEYDGKMEERDILEFISKTVPKETERRSIGNYKFGTLIKNQRDLDSLLLSGYSFFILDHSISDDERKAFTELPPHVGYICIEDKSLFKGIDEDFIPTPISFYQTSKAEITEYDGELTNESILNYLNSSNETKVGSIEGIKFGSVIRVQGEVSALKSSGTGFFLTDSVPTKAEKNALIKADVGFFVTANQSVRSLFGEGSEKRLCYYENDSLIDISDTISLQIIQEFFKLKDEHRTMEGIKYGSVIDDDQLQRLTEGNHSFFLLQHEPTEEEKTILENLPENVGFFVIKKKTLESHTETLPQTDIVFFDSEKKAIVDFGDKISNQNFNSLFSRQFEAIPFGAELDEIMLRKLMASGKSFFLLPNDQNVSIFKDLTDIGYFICNNNAMLGGLEGVMFFSGIEKSLRQAEVSSKEELEQFLEEESKREICGVRFGSTITEDNLPDLLQSGRRFLLIDHAPLAEERAQLGALPDDIGFFLFPDCELTSENRHCFVMEDGTVHSITTIDVIESIIANHSHSQTVDGIKAGTVITDEKQLEKLKGSGKPFVLFTHAPTTEELEKIPPETPFFVIGKKKLIENMDSGVAKTAVEDDKVIAVAFDGSEMREINSDTDIQSILTAQAKDDHYKTKEEIQELMKEKSFILMNRKPTDEEIAEAEKQNVPIYYVTDNSVLEDLNLSAALYDINTKEFRNLESTNIQPTNETEDVEVLNGDEIENENQIEAIKNQGKSYFLLATAPTEAERQMMEDLPPEVGFFILKNPNLIKKLSKELDANDGPVYYDAERQQFVQLPGVSELLEEAEMRRSPDDYINEDEREIAGIKYGSPIGKPSEIDLLKKAEKSFFLLSHFPNEEEKEALKDLPSDIGYFVLKTRRAMGNDYDPVTEHTFYRHFDGAVIEFADEINKDTVQSFIKRITRPITPQRPTSARSSNPRFSHLEQPEVGEEPTIRERKEEPTVRISLKELADEANQAFNEDVDEDEALNKILTNLNHQELDPEEVEGFESSDDEFDDPQQDADFHEVFEDFLNESLISTDCFADSEDNPESDIGHQSTRPKSARKSRIPVHRRHVKDTESELDEDDNYDENDNENENEHDTELNAALEEELLGQLEIPEDCPRDAFGFPTTRAKRAPKIRAHRTLRSLAREVKKRYIRLTKKAHSRFPATNERRVSIIKLIEQCRAIAEWRFINRRMRAMTRVNTQLRLAPSEPYTSFTRNREGRRMMLALRSASRRIDILRAATAVNDRGQSIYQLESAMEAERVKRLVVLSKRKKAVTDLELEVAQMKQHLADVEKRIKLMTQKESDLRAFNRRPEEPPSPREPTAPRSRPSSARNLA